MIRPKRGIASLVLLGIFGGMLAFMGRTGNRMADALALLVGWGSIAISAGWAWHLDRDEERRKAKRDRRDLARHFGLRRRGIEQRLEGIEG